MTEWQATLHPCGTDLPTTMPGCWVKVSACVLCGSGGPFRRVTWRRVR